VRLYGPDGQLVPAGVIGEIYFGGAGVALGYLDRDDLTRERFVNLDGERFYRTGDLGRGDAEGNIEILGRSDFQIKLRGIRIELGDIETTLRKAPGVEEAVVVGRDLGGDDKSLVAYVVPAQGQSLDIRAIRQFLQTKLPDYMVPFAYVVLEALPVNLNNKLDRAALPAPTVADLGRLRSFDPPRNDRERKLIEIWENVLGIRPIGVKDNFFEIGGDSLQSVSLMVEIERALGRPLALSTVITDPTIEKMAALFEPDLGPDLEPGQPSQSGMEGPRTPMVLLRAGGSAPPVFFVHDGEGEVLPYRNLALRIHPAHPVYGIRPVGDRQHPMMHTRISDLVETYTAEIRRIQPRGPYLLGGLCIGGFIAFEIARKLKNEGEQIGAVALIDAAHVTARGKSLGARRLRSFSGVIETGRGPGGDRRQMRQLVGRALEKVSNLIRYEIRTRIEGRRNRLKMRLFRFCLDRDLPLPPVVRDIPVRVVLRFAEKEYLVPAPYLGEVALFRATHRDDAFDGTLIDDTPYVDLFVDPLLGWKDKVGRLEVHDLSGGHSSMLMEPNVETLALKFGDYLDRGLGAVQSRTDVERIDQRHAPTEHAA
jgi:thioesterase domain-containing protein